MIWIKWRSEEGSFAAKLANKPIPGERLDPPINSKKIPVAKIPIILQKNAQLPDKSLQTNTTFFLLPLQFTIQILQQYPFKSVFYFSFPVHLAAFVRLGYLVSKEFYSHLGGGMVGVELFGLES